MKRGIEPFICFSTDELRAAEERYKTLFGMIDGKIQVVSGRRHGKTQAIETLKHYLRWEESIIKILKERGVK